MAPLVGLQCKQIGAVVPRDTFARNAQHRRPASVDIRGGLPVSDAHRTIGRVQGRPLLHTTHEGKEAFMAMTLNDCAEMLSRQGMRHHVDAEEGVIRGVFLTRHYRNPRGERLAIVRIDMPDDGHRCRVSIPRAFTPGADATAACLTLCRAAADTPLIGIEYDADGEGLRLVAEAVVEDGSLTPLQLLSMIDAIVAAAEAWHVALVGATPAAKAGRSPGSRRRRGAA